MLLGIAICFYVIALIIDIIIKNNERGTNMYNDEDKKNINVKKIAYYSILIIIGIFMIFLLFTNIYSVKTGEIAIVSTFGKISKTQNPGLHAKIPFIQNKKILETREKSYIFAKTNEMDTTLEVSTKDIQSIKIELTMQARIVDPMKLYTAFSDKYESRLIRPRIKEIVQNTIAKYTIEEFVTKRSEISRIINQDIYDDLYQYGIDTSNVSITNHDFSDEYEKAVEQKKVAEQAVEKAKAEQSKLLLEQENKVKLAELELKRRELEAKANSIESQTLTPQLLKKMAIEKWDGKLPQVQGNNSNTLLELK